MKNHIELIFLGTSERFYAKNHIGGRHAAKIDLVFEEGGYSRRDMFRINGNSDVSTGTNRMTRAELLGQKLTALVFPATAFLGFCLQAVERENQKRPRHSTSRQTVTAPKPRPTRTFSSCSSPVAIGLSVYNFIS